MSTPERDGVSLTHLDEPLFDGADATKRDLVDYLDAVSGLILPELRGRAELLAAQAKLHGSNAAWEAADHAVQVFGGRGWSTLYRPGRHLMDVRVCRIYEGTDEILKLKIAAALCLIGLVIESFGRLSDNPSAACCRANGEQKPRRRQGVPFPPTPPPPPLPGFFSSSRISCTHCAVLAGI